MNDENVRVLPTSATPTYAYTEPERRSDAQKVQDTVLEMASDAAQRALDASNEALEWLSVLTPPKHRQVPVYVQQLVEEIAELRRVRM